MRKNLLALTAILALVAGIGCSKKKDDKNNGTNGRCGAGQVYVTDTTLLQVLNGGGQFGGGNIYNQQYLQPRCVTTQEYQYAIQQTGGGNYGNGGQYADYCAYWANQGYDYNQCLNYCATNGRLCY